MLSLITNTSASVAQRNLGDTNRTLSSTLEKLSSGLRVNKASDDVASMAIGSRLNSELTALRTVATNAGQAVSLLQIAEGTYSRINDMLVRMKSLSSQSANGTLSDTERQLLDVEFQALKNEIDRVAADTEFNGQTLVNAELTTNTISDEDTAADGYVVNVVGNVDATGDFAVSALSGGLYTISVDGYSGTVSNSLVSAGALTEQVVVTMTHATNEGSLVLTLGTGYGIAADAGGTLDGGTANVLDIATSTSDATVTKNFRVGSGSNSSEDVISATINGANATYLGFDSNSNSTISITTTANADKASALVDCSIN